MTKIALQTLDKSGWEIDNKILTNEEFENLKMAYPHIDWIQIVWAEPIKRQENETTN